VVDLTPEQFETQYVLNMDPCTFNEEARPMLLRRILSSLAFAILTLTAPAALAQDIAGTWQGTIELWGRTVLKISKSDSGTLKADMYHIDGGATRVPVTTSPSLVQPSHFH
jgi:hypothetical protein